MQWKCLKTEREMNEKLIAKQEKHAKRWRKENEIYQRMKTLHKNVPSAILKEVESGFLEYKPIEGCEDFYFKFTLDRRCHICYTVKQHKIWYLLDSKDEHIAKTWKELRNRVTLEVELCNRAILGFKKGAVND